MADTTTVLEPGAEAPFFEASDEQGHIHRSTGYRGSTLVLCFFSPGLPREARRPGDFGEAFPGLRKKDVFLLGVQRGTTRDVGEFRRLRAVPFPILADDGGRIARAYGMPENGHASFVAIGADGRVRLVLKRRSNPSHIIDLLKRL